MENDNRGYIPVPRPYEASERIEAPVRTGQTVILAEASQAIIYPYGNGAEAGTPKNQPKIDSRVLRTLTHTQRYILREKARERLGGQVDTSRITGRATIGKVNRPY